MTQEKWNDGHSATLVAILFAFVIVVMFGIGLAKPITATSTATPMDVALVATSTSAVVPVNEVAQVATTRPTAIAPVEANVNTVTNPTSIDAANPDAGQNITIADTNLLDPVLVYRGSQLFGQSCVACHGTNGQGIPGLGKTMVGSEFIDGLTDEGMVAFLLVGRGTTDPLNTTGIMMPARGGNGGLTDTDLLDITYYIRSLNGVPVAAVVAQEGVPEVTYEAREFVPLPFNSIDASSVPASLAFEHTPETMSTVPATATPEGVAVSVYDLSYEHFLVPHHDMLNTPAENFLAPSDDALAIIQGERAIFLP